MPQYHTLEELHLQNAWVTVGSFDGIHLGHQAIIRRLVRQAHEACAPAVVVTFYPHPAVVLRGIQPPYYLTTPEERTRLLTRLGVDHVITLRFDRELAQQPAREFVEKMIRRLGMRQLWIGYDFALGRGREGKPEMLKSLGQELGFDVQVVEPIQMGDTTVSSSLIRQSLAEGNIRQVNTLLGRSYTLRAQVTSGDGRGKGMGIPTANLDLPAEILLPVYGVYATWCHVDGKIIPAATNVGQRPTFEGEPVSPRVEPHLLDYEGNLYGKEIALEFIEYIRPEQRFDNAAALIEQIQKDIQTIREVLSHATPTPDLSA